MTYVPQKYKLRTSRQPRILIIFPNSQQILLLSALQKNQVSLRRNFLSFPAPCLQADLLLAGGEEVPLHCLRLIHCLGEGNGTPLQYSCLENPMDGRAWQAAVHGVAKSQTRQTDFTFTFHFHALEKEMATHSSVLAWRIPGTGEPGGLPSMGSHRVGHN